MSSRDFSTSCLIIGTGISGLCAAVALADEGVETTLITSAPEITTSNTLFAQGGIIYESNNHDPNGLVTDILEAGCYTNYRPAVDLLALEGPDLIRRVLIEKVGVDFDRSATGEYHLTREGGHSEPRIIHKNDESGKLIEEQLAAYCLSRKSIRIFPATSAVNLLMTSFHDKQSSGRHEPAKCFGAFVFDQKAAEVYPIFATHTIIATGGLGQIYSHNTNSKYARGDGIALARRAGCRLESLEYVQFHPTTFFHEKSRRFLISEALRGEGAVLVNQQGERFLGKYLAKHPAPELAPRDRVAKAIHEEMLSSGSACVYLDISHKPVRWVKERFPFVYRSCLNYGVDITQQPIPVVPGAHYLCGGIWTDLDGRTTLPNLWAVGEVASTGLHGANRLASTSLLEGLVWGTRAGKSIVNAVKETTPVAVPSIEPWKSESATVDPAFLSQDWLTLKQTMWNYVGLIKTEARLNRARGILTELKNGIDTFYQRAALSDALIGLRHAALTAMLVVEACQRNRHSLGCYIREDLEI